MTARAELDALRVLLDAHLPTRLYRNSGTPSGVTCVIGAPTLEWGEGLCPPVGAEVQVDVVVMAAGPIPDQIGDLLDACDDLPGWAAEGGWVARDAQPGTGPDDIPTMTVTLRKAY
jgi:hypothetical protein